MKTSIVFFGTPEFAVPALKALIEAPFCDVCLVVTQPDKPVGRHYSKQVPSPVKQIAQEHEIEVITPRHPELVSGSVFEKMLKQVQHDGVTQDDGMQLGVLVAYGEIIPKNVIDAFPLGILNIHPSLLPKYRGSSPIQAAILNQDAETGATLMKLDDQMDHGPIVAQAKMSLRAEGEAIPSLADDGTGLPRSSAKGGLPRNDNMTAGELHDKLSILGAKLLIKTLPDYIAGRIKPKPQDDSQASYTQKLTKADGRIDWSKSPEEISAQVRAMNPWPGAWTSWRGKKLIIWSITKDGTPGDVQLEAKKRMPYEEFKRGYPDFEITDFFSSL